MVHGPSMRSTRKRVRQAAEEKELLASQAPAAKLRRAEAGKVFRNDMIDRFAHGKIQPIDLATISWFATEAGAGGVSDLGVDSDKSFTWKNLMIS